MFSPLSNMKASDKTSKKSLRDVFEAGVVCYDKTIPSSFPIIKRKCLTSILTCQKRQSSLSLEFVCFVIRKLSVNLMWRSFCYLYIQMKVTKLYEIKLTITVCDRIFFFFTDRSMFWNYIAHGEKQLSHHLYRGHHMFSLSLVYL